MDVDIRTAHLESLEQPPLQLESYVLETLSDADTALALNVVRELPALWPTFIARLEAEDVLPLARQWEAELHFVDNPTIQRLNADYRQKDQPTDVLSFSLYADGDDASKNMPLIALGSIIISVPYARQHHEDEPLAPYLLERIFHGFLHLLGMHHDTMEAYEKVVAIQKHVLSARKS